MEKGRARIATAEPARLRSEGKSVAHVSSAFFYLYACFGGQPFLAPHWKDHTWLARHYADLDACADARISYGCYAIGTQVSCAARSTHI